MFIIGLLGAAVCTLPKIRAAGPGLVSTTDRRPGSGTGGGLRRSQAAPAPPVTGAGASVSLSRARRWDRLVTVTGKPESLKVQPSTWHVTLAMANSSLSLSTAATGSGPPRPAAADAAGGPGPPLAVLASSDW